MLEVVLASYRLYVTGRQEELDEMPRPGEDPIISDDMTDVQKAIANVEISRNCMVRRIQAEMARTITERNDRRAYLDDRFGETRTAPRPAPGLLPYKEPRFEPGCPRASEIADFLFRHRVELALDTLWFEIAEHGPSISPPPTSILILTLPKYCIGISFVRALLALRQQSGVGSCNTVTGPICFSGMFAASSKIQLTLSKLD